VVDGGEVGEKRWNASMGSNWGVRSKDLEPPIYHNYGEVLWRAAISIVYQFEGNWINYAQAMKVAWSFSHRFSTSVDSSIARDQVISIYPIQIYTAKSSTRSKLSVRIEAIMGIEWPRVSLTGGAKPNWDAHNNR
jgi:hypothetical protein